MESIKALRTVLLGLAAVIVVALCWRFVHLMPASAPSVQPPRVAAGQEPAASQPVSEPTTGSPEAAPPQTAAPNPERAPDQAGQTPPPPAPAADVPPPSAQASQTAPAPPQTEATVPTTPPVTPEIARQGLESSLAAAPDLARAFQSLRAEFPAVADHVLEAAAQKLTTSGQTTPPDDLLASAMRELRQNAGVLAAKAGPEALSAIFDRQAATLADLAQTDPQVCADYLYGGTSPEYAAFASGHRALIAALALANINAMTEGRKQQIAHAPPTTDDFSLVEAGLTAKGLSPDEIAALLDGKSLDPPLPDARLCSDARTYLDVLHGLPEDVRLRIYALAAELLARS